MRLPMYASCGRSRPWRPCAGIGFRKRVERVLRRLLIAGDPVGGTSLEQMAALFRLHPRTPQSAPPGRGHEALETLLDESRYRIARQLLRDTLLSVEDLAIALGYADATAFSRAFRRWSGTSPSCWRANQPRVERTDAAGGGRDPPGPAPDLEPRPWCVEKCQIGPTGSRHNRTAHRAPRMPDLRMVRPCSKIDGSTFTPASPITQRKIQ